jgi:hypothetical protein
MADLLCPCCGHVTDGVPNPEGPEFSTDLCDDCKWELNPTPQEPPMPLEAALAAVRALFPPHLTDRQRDAVQAALAAGASKTQLGEAMGYRGPNVRSGAHNWLRRNS